MKNLPRRWALYVLATATLSGLLIAQGGGREDPEPLPRALAVGPTTPRPTARAQGPFLLLRAYAWAPDLDSPATAWVQFSRPLDPIQPPAPIALEPPVANLTVTVRDEELRLSGDLEPGRVYRVSMGARLRAADGQTLGEDAHALLRVPDLAPRLSLVGAGGILSPHGRLQLELRSVNVSSAQLRLRRVLPNNLAAQLHGAELDSTSRELFEKTLPLAHARNRGTTTLLELGRLVEKPLGVYHLEVQDASRSWTDDEALLRISDLGLSVKLGREQALVWVTSLRHGRPIADARVQVLDYQNQILATSRSDRDGLALLELPIETRPWLVLAERDGDLNYLLSDERHQIDAKLDDQGRPQPRTYDAFVYTDRGLYRPGEAVQLTGVLRERDGATPPAFPLELVCLGPDGRRSDKHQVTPDAQGMFQVEHASGPHDLTGPWRFQLHLPGATQILGETRALIEAFVPQRLKVEAAPGRPPVVNVAAVWLQGGPAGGLPCRMTGRFRATAYRSARFPGYRFDTRTHRSEVPLKPIARPLDEDGRACIEIPAEDLPNDGCYRLEGQAAVQAPGGRTVAAPYALDLDREAVHTGLCLGGEESAWPRAGEPLTLDFVQVDPEDAPRAQAFTLVLRRLHYDWLLQEVNGRPRWQRQEREQELTRIEVPANEPVGRIVLEALPAGPHRLLAEPALGAATVLDFEVAAAGASRQAHSEERIEELTIRPERTSYEPGQNARLLARGPFPGLALLTLETDRVLQWRLVELADGAQTVDLPVPENLRGGARIGGLLLRPIDPTRTSWLPPRALGWARLETEHPRSRLAVQISAPARARPGARVEVVCDVPGAPQGTRVHLWAADEGILLAAAHATPDPAAHFLGPRRSEVATSDIFDELLPDYERAATLARIGGDGDQAARRLRHEPVPLPRRASAVIQGGIQDLDAAGRCRIACELPDFSGSLRWMAVAVAGDRYGSAQAHTEVTTPLQVELSLPRFLAPGDETCIAVTIINQTSEAVTARLRAEVQGPLELAGLPETVDLAPGARATQTITARAAGTGEARLTIVAQGSPGIDGQAHEVLGLRPARPLTRQGHTARLSAGETLEIPPAPGLVAAHSRRRLHVGSAPQVELSEALAALVEYPHGCVEQTSSRVWALLRLPDGLPDARNLVQAGIGRLWTMQTAEGGLAYWPEGAQAHDWGSAYAARVLLAARTAGYEVDQARLGALTAYLERRVLGSGNQGDDGTLALVCRLLAEQGRAPLGWLKTLTERQGVLDLGARADLAAALARAGDLAQARALLADLPLGSPWRGEGQRLGSQLQHQAVALEVLLEVDAGHPGLATLVRRIEAGRRQGRWGNTLENAAALSALARYQARPREASDFQGEVIIDGQTIARFDHRQELSLDLEARPGALRLVSQGRGSIYVACETVGPAADQELRREDRGLIVRRRWLDLEGRSLDLTTLRAGQLFQCELSLQAPKGETVPHVALVDMMPGGIEVENPRLAGSEGAAPAPRTPERIDFRDDRVLIFDQAGPEPRAYRYALRAVAAGRYAWPPVQGSSMYDEERSSLSGGGQIEIAP